MKMKPLLIMIAVVVFLSSSLTWLFQDWRYDGKLKAQEIAYNDIRNQAKEEADKRFKEFKDNAQYAEKTYKDRISTLESTVANLDSVNLDSAYTIDRLRKQERDLHTRIRDLSRETLSEYATAATEAVTEISAALREEQLAHQETSREAEQYWLGWKALDQSWEVRMKESGNE